MPDSASGIPVAEEAPAQADLVIRQFVFVSVIIPIGLYLIDRCIFRQNLSVSLKRMSLNSTRHMAGADPEGVVWGGGSRPPPGSTPA